MVSSKGRRLSSRLHARSIDLSPLDHRQRRSRPRPRREPSTTPKNAFVDVGGAAEDTGKNIHQAATVAKKLPSIAIDEPTLPASSPPPLLLACHVCRQGKDAIRKPVVTCCGHLFCWRCLLKRLPSEGPSHDLVMLSCPVCDTTQYGLLPNRALNTIIPLHRIKDPVTDCTEGDAEQPLPLPNAYPIPIFDEKVQMYHETAQELKSAENCFTSMLDQRRETRSSIVRHMQQTMESITRQLSI